MPDSDRRLVIRALAAGAGSRGRVSQALADACGQAGPAAAYWTARLQGLVDAGVPLRVAVQAVPQLFPDVVSHVIAAAERTGTLAAALDRLEAVLARKSKLHSLVARSLAYPVATLALALPLIIVATTVVLPDMACIFEDAGMALPGPTKALARFGLWARVSWRIGIGAVPVLVVGLYWAYRHAGRIASRTPVLGRALSGAGWANLCLTLADCVESGMSTSQALGTASTVGGPEIRGATLAASTLVAAGAPLGRCLDGFRPVVRRELGAHDASIVRRLKDAGELLGSTSAAQVEAFIMVAQPVLTTLIAIVIGAVSVVICLPALSTVNIP